MADQSGSGSTGLAFIVGALAVAVVVLGYFVLGGNLSGGGKDIDVKIEAPAPKKSE